MATQNDTAAIEQTLRGSSAPALLEALGNTADQRTVRLLQPVVTNPQADLTLRKIALKSMTQSQAGIAAMIQLALNHFVFQQATVEMEVSEGRDYASRLRYEAQDLIQDLRKQVRRKKPGSDQTIKQVEQVMDEIETITTNLDALLAQANNSDMK